MNPKTLTPRAFLEGTSKELPTDPEIKALFIEQFVTTLYEKYNFEPKSTEHEEKYIELLESCSKQEIKHFIHCLNDTWKDIIARPDAEKNLETLNNKRDLVSLLHKSPNFNKHMLSLLDDLRIQQTLEANLSRGVSPPQDAPSEEQSTPQSSSA